MPYETYQIRSPFYDNGLWLIRQIENGKVIGISKRTFETEEEANQGIQRIEEYLNQE